MSRVSTCVVRSCIYKSRKLPFATAREREREVLKHRRSVSGFSFKCVHLLTTWRFCTNVLNFLYLRASPNFDLDVNYFFFFKVRDCDRLRFLCFFFFFFFAFKEIYQFRSSKSMVVNFGQGFILPTHPSNANFVQSVKCCQVSSKSCQSSIFSGNRRSLQRISNLVEHCILNN